MEKHSEVNVTGEEAGKCPEEGGKKKLMLSSSAIFRQLRFFLSDLAKRFGVETTSTFGSFSRCLITPKGIHQICGRRERGGHS